MCLILVAVRTHPSYDLILAANRDEYYARPSLPPAFWDEAEGLLAGRDLVGGGTWLGITRSGRLAAITNYRNPALLLKDAPSRGRLVTDFLKGRQAPAEYLLQVRQGAEKYNGFNLVVGDVEKLYWYSNRGGEIHLLHEGIYGISNRLLDTPWPKVVKGKRLLAGILEEEEPSSDELFRLLQDREQPADELLPSTGVEPAWERILSPIFIESPTYGTRSSTLIFIGKDRHVTFFDKTFNPGPDQKVESRRFEFDIEERVPAAPSVPRSGVS
jgi:uncharacterized protein with NRDE domain